MSAPAQYSKAFKRELAKVVIIEGGYSNDPDDPGGRTYRGLTERYYPELWANGRPTDAQVDYVFWWDFWCKLSLDSFDCKPLQAELFDSAVNCGAGTAAMWLQEAYNGVSEYYGWVHLDVDGAIGPKSRAAVRRWIRRGKSSQAALVVACNYLQCDHYWHGQPKFRVGWFAKRGNPEGFRL